MIKVILAVVFMVFIAGCEDQNMSQQKVSVASPLSGEVVYWKEGSEVMARVIFFESNGSLILEAKQSEEALEGILIKRIDVPGCGQIEFKRYDLDSLRGIATASSPESFPDCKIPNWAGEWRIGKLL